MLWNRFSFLASVWLSEMGTFRGEAISYVHRIGIGGLSFVKGFFYLIKKNMLCWKRTGGRLPSYWPSLVVPKLCMGVFQIEGHLHSPK